MDEYVEREKIWPALNASCVPYNRATAKAIESIPAADVQPVVHGKNKSANGFLCSVCSFGDFGGFHGYGPNFCPNCGAKMDK